MKPKARVFRFDGVEALTPKVLETFPYEYPAREAMVEIETDEWSCVCPFSGLPDFGRLTVSYLPSDVCIELKSLKYYLTELSQRRHLPGARGQPGARRPCGLLSPQWMEVELDYRLRGGLHTVVTVAHGEDESEDDQ